MSAPLDLDEGEAGESEGMDLNVWDAKQSSESDE